MKWIALIIFVLFLNYSCALTVLHDQEIPKDHPFGSLNSILFKNDKILFNTQDHDLGIINLLTGQFKAVYELDQDQSFVEEVLFEEMVVRQGKSINIFYPFDERYEQLPQSAFLQKQQFETITSLLRTSKYQWVLTDTFLAKIPSAVQSEQQAKIIRKKQEGETFFKLVYFESSSKQEEEGVLLAVLGKDRTSLCLEKFYHEGQPSKPFCLRQKTQETLKQVLNIGSHILVVYQKHKIFLDPSFTTTKEVQPQQLMSEAEQMTVTLNPAAQNNLHSHSQVTTVMFGGKHHNGPNNIQYSSEEILVRQDDRVFLVIQKEEGQVPQKVWVHTDLTAQQLYLIIEMKGSITVAYQVDLQKKTHKVIWKVQFGKFKRLSGKLKKAELWSEIKDSAVEEEDLEAAEP